MKPHESKRKVTFIIPDAVTEAMKVLAETHRRSLNAEVVWALERYISEESGDSVS